MSASEWVSIVAMFGAIWLVALAPLLVPLFFAARFGAKTPRRWLFVFLATVSGYGFIGLLSVLIWLPVEFLASKVAPVLTVSAPETAAWLNPILNTVYGSMHWVGALLMVVFSIVFTRYFWPRWSRIVPAL